MGDVGKKEEKESRLEKIIKEGIKEVWYGKSKEGGDKGRTLTNHDSQDGTKASQNKNTNEPISPNSSDVLVWAEKLISGEEFKSKKPYADEAAVKKEREHLNAAILDFVKFSQKRICTMEKYDRAGAILKYYYGKDSILDFWEDLDRAWKEEAEAPDMYAKELYYNYLVNILRCFQKMQAKMDEEGSENPKLSEQEALERYHFSDPPLSAFIRLTKETRRLYNGKKANAESEEAASAFKRSAKQLAETFLNEKYKLTEEKVKSFADFIQEAAKDDQRRTDGMYGDIAKADAVYGRLAEALSGEEAAKILEQLDPKNGILEGKSVEEIQELYRPLMEKLESITAEYHR